MTEFVRECRKKRAEHEAFFRLFYARRMPAVPAACFAVKGSRRRRKGKVQGMRCGRGPGASVLFVYPRSQREEKEPGQAVSGGTVCTTSPSGGFFACSRRGRPRKGKASGRREKKSAAFAAVPDIIRKGTVFDRQSNGKGRGYDTSVISAPVRIGDTDYAGEVVVEHLPGRQGLYLHEVENKKRLEDAFKTPTEGSASQASRLILGQKLDGVKRASKVVDDEGRSFWYIIQIKKRRLLNMKSRSWGTPDGSAFPPLTDTQNMHGIRSERVSADGVSDGSNIPGTSTLHKGLPPLFCRRDRCCGPCAG